MSAGKGRHGAPRALLESEDDAGCTDALCELPEGGSFFQGEPLQEDDGIECELTEGGSAFGVDFEAALDKLQEDDAPQIAKMPARWRGVHDCDRPAKWRESMDDEACEALLRDSPGGSEDAAQRRGANAKTKAASAASSRLPAITTMEDFVAATERAKEGDRLMVVKFYSERCRACLGIAPKFRRLAKDLDGSVDFYEVEVGGAMALAKQFGVVELPTVQIYDCDNVTRLGSYSCAPPSWKKAEKKLRFFSSEAEMKRIGEPLKGDLSI